MTRLERYGWRGGASAGIARVVSAHGDYYHIVCDEADGEILARKKASAFRAEGAVAPLTGDFVRFEYNPHGESRIVETLERFSEFRRLDPSGCGRREQTVAVNFDTIFFLTSLNGNYSQARVERFLALAEASGCLSRAVVVLSKCDLAEGGAVPALPVPGVPSVAISARTGAGMEGVAGYVLPGRTVALVGSSGVGKSTLVNTLAGEEWMAVREIQAWSGKGRHTTTSRELVMLPSGAMAIDTPGMREMGIFGEDSGERFLSTGSHRYRFRQAPRTSCPPLRRDPFR